VNKENYILTAYTCVQSFRPVASLIRTIPVGLGWGGKHVVIMLTQSSWAGAKTELGKNLVRDFHFFAQMLGKSNETKNKNLG